MKKLIWGIATAAAIILVIFAMRGFPPVEHGTEGTVGAAKKYQGTGLVASRRFIDASPDTVEKTLRALIRANRFIQDKNNQPAIIRSLRKWLRLAPTDSGEDLYNRIRLLYDRSIVPTKEGIQSALQLLAKSDPKFAKLKADDLIDDRIARKLEKEGM